MPFISRPKFSALKNLFSRIPSFSRTGRHSLTLLNTTQFLGVINDNVFKFVMAFLLIDSLGSAQASTILSATGAIYVIPFLLFSSSAGILADRFSKQQLLVIMKGAEIVVMVLALFAFGFKNPWGCYTLLFILATHSAMFGPSKYGIIAELVPTDKVSHANGLITSFTYLAIIIGTFLASFLTEITNRDFIYIAVFCLAIAIGGFVSALFIKKTIPQGSQKKMNIFFIREIYDTLSDCRKEYHLLPSIFGSSFFLFIGAFTQLNIIPFALQSLNLPEIAGGYLFLATALGIAFGSFLAGRASRNRIELGMSCLAGFGISVFFLLISIFSHSLIIVTLSLISIGILGGIFIVPFDTFIQLNSGSGRRGQTIAAANFLSFGGVLIASVSLFVFNELLDFSSATSFGTVGIITLFVSLALTFRLSDLSLPYFSRKILQPFLRFRTPDTDSIEYAKNAVLILEKGSWCKAILLLGTIPNIHLLIPLAKGKKAPWLGRLFYSIHYIPAEESFEGLVDAAKEYRKKGGIPCVFLQDYSPKKIEENPAPFFNFLKNASSQVWIVRPDRTPNSNQLTFSFSKKV